MTVRVKAHFDGTNFVPEEPVDWPVGTSVVVEFAPGSAINSPSTSIEERKAAMRRMATRGKAGPGIPPEALRRENMYGDEGR